MRLYEANLLFIPRINADLVYRPMFACEIIFSAVDIICTAISIVFYHKDSFHLLKILWLLILAVQANLLYLPVLN